MGDNRTDLPEGTDTIIEGAAGTAPLPAGGGTDPGTEELIVTEARLVRETDSGQPASGSGSTDESTDTGLRQRIRSGGERLSTEAGDRARGIVTQGLERSAEALSNVSRLVGDTAAGLDERLGPDYGEYARRAASAIENVADSIASKNPDELIEDTRNFVRNSPGVAIAGAAIVGFALARLLKSGLSTNSRDEADDER